MEQVDKDRYAAEKVKFEKYLKSHPDKAPVTSKKGQVTSKKAPEAGPKRSTSAFFFFQADRREPLKKEKPNLNHKEIVSVSCLNNVVGFGRGVEVDD